MVVGEIIAIFAIWHVTIGVLELVSPIFLPSPGAVAEGLGRLVTSGNLVHHGSYSAINLTIGFGLASGAGIAFGIIVGASYPLARLIGPLAWALYAMPFIAIRPMTTIWFGFGSGPIIFLVFLGSFLPIFLNTMAGVSTVDTNLLRAARVFGAGRIQLWFHVVLPSTIPFIVTGLRLGVVSGLIMLLVSEMVGSPRGLGAIVIIATSRFRTDEAFAAIAVIITVSVLLVRALTALEVRVQAWRAEAA